MRGNTTMPAGRLHVLLWHYFTPEPYPRPSGCHEEFVLALIADGLIEYLPTREEFLGNEMELTDKGRVYVEAILAVPLPVQKWVMAA